MQPPRAKLVPNRSERHGATVEDDWAWLADREDPDTIAYLEAENAYANAWFEPLTDLRETIFGELRSRTQETDLSVPVRSGPWDYYGRTVEGMSYPIHCRRPGGAAEGAGEVVLLDENERAEGSAYFALGVFDVSPDHRLLAWAHDGDGSEVHTLRLRDLDTGVDLPDAVEGVYYGSAWSRDGRWIFYVRTDEAMRPHQVWRHELGTDGDDDVCVFTEDDEHFYVGVGLTRSEAFVVIESASKTSSEAWVIDADQPTVAPRIVEPRREGHEYSIDHRGDHFVILTNDDAEDFRVVTAPVAEPGIGRWVELVAHRPGTRVTDVDAFRDHVVISQWSSAREELRIIDDTGGDQVLAFDEEVHSVGLGSNPEFTSRTLRLGYQSMTTPASVLDHDLDTGERRLLKQTPVLGGVDLGCYEAERHWARSADGTGVPLDVVRRRDVPIVGTLLYAYGAYEISIPPYFSIARLSLLDRGVAFALAHPRGGGELGRAWYLEGKLAAKHHTFEDLIGCAEHLVQTGITPPVSVVARGGSAGGLTVGAAMSMRPELFAAIVAEVPFVDVVNTMLDETLPLTVTEWEEWGNPAVAEDHATIAAYAPYDNVRPVTYPALYATAGLNDPRVSYHEPAKWIAKLRATAIGGGPFLLRTEMGAGHGGPSGRYDEWRDEARTLAFVLAAIGITS